MFLYQEEAFLEKLIYTDFFCTNEILYWCDTKCSSSVTPVVKIRDFELILALV